MLTLGIPEKSWIAVHCREASQSRGIPSAVLGTLVRPISNYVNVVATHKAPVAYTANWKRRTEQWGTEVRDYTNNFVKSVLCWQTYKSHVTVMCQVNQLIIYGNSRSVRPKRFLSLGKYRYFYRFLLRPWSYGTKANTVKWTYRWTNKKSMQTSAIKL